MNFDWVGFEVLLFIILMQSDIYIQLVYLLSNNYFKKKLWIFMNESISFFFFLQFLICIYNTHVHTENQL